jgi:hypothetical protein
MRGGAQAYGAMMWLMYFSLFMVDCEVGKSQTVEPLCPPSLSVLPGILSGPAWALSGNPAALALARGFASGAGYENKYGVKELHQTGFHVQWGKNTYGLGFIYENGGPAFYRFQTFGAAYGQHLGKHMLAGVRMVYRRLVVSDFNMKSSVLACDLGFRAKLSRKMSFSSVLKAPIGYHFNRKQGQAATYEAGILYQADPFWTISLEVHKLPEFKPSLVFGAAIRPSSFCSAWLRYFTNPWRLELGCGLRRGNVDFYTYADYHAVLGLSPGIMLIVTFTKK